MKITELHVPGGPFLKIKGEGFEKSIRMNPGESPEDTLERYCEEEREIRAQSNRRQMRAKKALFALREGLKVQEAQ